MLGVRLFLLLCFCLSKATACTSHLVWCAQVVSSEHGLLTTVAYQLGSRQSACYALEVNNVCAVSSCSTNELQRWFAAEHEINCLSISDDFCFGSSLGNEMILLLVKIYLSDMYFLLAFSIMLHDRFHSPLGRVGLVLWWRIDYRSSLMKCSSFRPIFENVNAQSVIDFITEIHFYHKL